MGKLATHHPDRESLNYKIFVSVVMEMNMTKSESSFRFDFEEWAKLAEQDPARFEDRRAQTISKAIDEVPQDKQQMLRRLQWKVDRVRELKSTPLAACIAITDMMWNTFHDLNRSYQWLGSHSDKSTPLEALPKATVLNFPGWPNKSADSVKNS